MYCHALIQLIYLYKILSRNQNTKIVHMVPKYLLEKNMNASIIIKMRIK